MKELSFVVANISDKEADDLSMQMVMWLEEQNYLVTTYYISEEIDEV